MLTNMINLPNFKVFDMKESEHDYRFLVEATALYPSYCPKFGTVANLYRHGKIKQLFFDLPMHAKRVGIYVNRQRYKCKECKETFFENLPDMDVNRSVTNRLINWIQEISLEKTFTSVAEEIGVSNIPKELMTYFEDLIKAMSNWEEEIFNYFNFCHYKCLYRVPKSLN